MMVTDHDSFEWCAFDRGGGPSESYGGTVPEIILVTVRHQQNGPPPKYVVLPDRLAKFYSVFRQKRLLQGLYCSGEVGECWCCFVSTFYRITVTLAGYPPTVNTLPDLKPNKRSGPQLTPNLGLIIKNDREKIPEPDIGPVRRNEIKLHVFRCLQNS